MPTTGSLRARLWFGAGRALTRVRRPARALAAFRGAVAADPRYARAWSGIGMLLAARGESAAAIAAFERALTLEPGDARSH
jgi:Flp pilus assembly protein TadD